LALVGDGISAERAYQLGLVNRVVSAEQVMDAAFDLANRIAANGPLGVAAAKEIARLAAVDGAAAAQRLDAIRPSVFESQDAIEGARAFMEKRPPIWSGR
jgi:enoyl-CoA hydratase/carnithine racemase